MGFGQQSCAHGCGAARDGSGSCTLIFGCEQHEGFDPAPEDRSGGLLRGLIRMPKAFGSDSDGSDVIPTESESFGCWASESSESPAYTGFFHPNEIQDKFLSGIFRRFLLFNWNFGERLFRLVYAHMKQNSCSDVGISHDLVRAKAYLLSVVILNIHRRFTL